MDWPLLSLECWRAGSPGQPVEHAVGVKNEGECSTFEEDLEDKRGFASVIEAVQIDDPTIFI